MTALPKKPRNWRKLKWNCWFEYTNDTNAVIQGKGRKMLVDGVELELFPSAVLCGMLHRTLRCLYKWEKNFGFPQALWRIRDDTHTNRWYSRRQLIAIRAAYEACGRLQGKSRPKLSQFIAAVRSFFYVIDNQKVMTDGKQTSERLTPPGDFLNGSSEGAAGTTQGAI